MSVTSQTTSRIEVEDTYAPMERGASGAAELEMTSVAHDAWDATVANFDGVCQEQLYAYASTRWGGSRIEPRLFEKDGVVVGGALVLLKVLPLGLATLALVKWGPMLADGDRADAEALVEAMTSALVSEYADHRGMMLSIMPKLEPQAENTGYGRLMARGFQKGMGVPYPDRYVVDVTLNDEDRLAAFAQKWRYHLRKSFKTELEFEHVEQPQLDRFMALYRAMSERKQFPDYSAIAELDNLLALPRCAGRPEMFFVTRGGETVAGAVIFTAGRTATYLYGATADAALDLRAGYFLHWHIIAWLRDNTRARLYDLGGTDGFSGLHQFKSGMVGSAGFVVPAPPFANYASSWRARLFGSVAYRGYEGLRNFKNRLVSARKRLMRGLRRDAA
ncbi:lipid II:glycine glycyltransferase FemX [Pelagibacterium montanilacus]|uniref:lipid II:glycine glycyltransferase FemX n=1 Tax=Pelagibacterium montanilacus TaxID=2185280 RepID=UPI000F8E54E7|nr:GNAT family N-acetyltransferase [Pelagibacterium montanilacus]